MKIDLDLERRLSALTGNHGGPALDWHGLRTRLAAGYAARSAAGAGKPCEWQARGGSFDRPSARALAVYGEAMPGRSVGVNPSALANGKPAHDNVAAFAGAPSVGD